MADRKTYQLPVGFYFRVEFKIPPSENGQPAIEIKAEDYDVRFQEVSGLNTSIETETFQEGGENRFSHRFPKPISYQNLVLKRGMLVGSKLISWFKNAIDNFQFTPGTVIVTLLNTESTVKDAPLEQWSFTNAYPVKWNIDAFNAQDGKIVAETIELSYQFYTRSELKKEVILREDTLPLGKPKQSGTK